MKPLPLVLIVLGASAISGGVAVLTTWSGPAHAGELDGPPAEVAALSERIDALAAQQAQIVGALERLESSREMRAPETSRLPVAEIDAAVARALEHRLGSAGGGGAPAEIGEAPAGDPDEAPAMELEDALAMIEDISDDVDWEATWKEIREAGLVDEVIAHFEAAAEREPTDPDLQVDLANAYVAKIFEVGNGPEAGVWAQKADSAYDAALAIDERHWEARFSKAIGLSFWPPIFGKQGEAIRHFEILRSQQKESGPAPEHVQTYHFLGNLYQQTGEAEKAIEVWKEGAKLFPQDDELAEKLASFAGDGE